MEEKLKEDSRYQDLKNSAFYKYLYSMVGWKLAGEDLATHFGLAIFAFEQEMKTSLFSLGLIVQAHFYFRCLTDDPKVLADADVIWVKSRKKQ